MERQIGNLVDAIANGDDAGRLRAQLADLEQIDHVAPLGTTNLMEELDKILGERRGWIGGTRSRLVRSSASWWSDA